MEGDISSIGRTLRESVPWMFFIENIIHSFSHISHITHGCLFLHTCKFFQLPMPPILKPNSTSEQLKASKTIPTKPLAHIPRPSEVRQMGKMTRGDTWGFRTTLLSRRLHVSGANYSDQPVEEIHPHDGDCKGIPLKMPLTVASCEGAHPNIYSTYFSIQKRTFHCFFCCFI